MGDHSVIKVALPQLGSKGVLQQGPIELPAQLSSPRLRLEEGLGGVVGEMDGTEHFGIKNRTTLYYSIQSPHDTRASFIQSRAGSQIVEHLFFHGRGQALP